MKSIERLGGVLGRAGSWLGSNSESAITSRLLVSVYVQQQQQEQEEDKSSPSMPPRTLTRRSRRILLTTSIWSVIIIVVAFFVTYTVLLVSVDRPFRSANDAVSGRHKVRYMGKGQGVNDETGNGPEQRPASGVTQRKSMWDPKLFNGAKLKPPQCRDNNTVIIIITSAPSHFEHRAEIRRTWCNSSVLTDTFVDVDSDRSHYSSVWQCVFLIGQTDDDSVRLKLTAEHQRHGDVLHGRYVDSYRNLTLKVMHALAWVSYNCVAPYVLKTDDDCFVNTALLPQFLTQHNKRTTNLYAGSIVTDLSKRKVIRSRGEKWAVSADDYPSKYYPKFASGGGYMLSSDVVTRLAEASVFVKPIPNEDAYVGIVMDRLGVEPTLSGRFSLASSGLRPCNFLYLLVVHGVEPARQTEMLTKMLTARTQCGNQQQVLTW